MNRRQRLLNEIASRVAEKIQEEQLDSHLQLEFSNPFKSSWSKVLDNNGKDGFTLKKGNLKGKDFTGFILRNARFTDVDFTGAFFSDTDLAGTHFKNCNLTGARFIGRAPHLKDVSFEGSVLKGVQFETYGTPALDFTTVDLGGAKIGDSTTFRHCNFAGMSLSGFRFYNVKFDHCNFKDADLSGASFIEVSMNLSDFSGANLNGATILSKNPLAGVRSAKFIDADLTGATVDQTILQGDLHGADLTGVTGVDTVCRYMYEKYEESGNPPLWPKGIEVVECKSY